MNTTPKQALALRRLVEAVFRREVIALEVEHSPTLLARLRLRLSLGRERRAIAHALRLGLRRERCYGAGDFTVWITPEGTVTVADDRLPQQVTLEEANRVLARHGLRLWPTSEDYQTAVLLNVHGRYLASASLWDDGGVDLMSPYGGKVALTHNAIWTDPEGGPRVVCELRTVVSAQYGEFRPPLTVQEE